MIILNRTGTGDTSVFGKDTRVREQLNQVTSFLDASTVYGSADEEMETLRDRFVLLFKHKEIYCSLLEVLEILYLVKVC